MIEYSEISYCRLFEPNTTKRFHFVTARLNYFHDLLARKIMNERIYDSQVYSKAYLTL